MRTATRLVRAVAVAALSSALALGPMVATASAADVSNFTAQGTGFALRVTVDMSGLPQAVKNAVQANYTTVRNAALPAVQAQLPVEFPFVIDQYVSRTTSDASSSLTKATSVLGDGFRNLGSVSADAVGQSNTSSLTDAVSIPSPTLPVLQASAGQLLASVATGPKVDGTASVASVTASLETIKALLPAAVQNVYTELQTTLNSTITTANTTLQGVAGEVSASLAGTPLASNPTVGPIVNNVTTLTSSLNLPAVPDVLSTKLAEVKDVVSKTTAQKADGKASSDAVSTIKSVDVLNGFVKVGVINLGSHSEAAGIIGSAKNSSTCSLADVRIGGNTGVSLDGSNVYIDVAGQPVALPVPAGQIASLKSQVDGVLSQAGVSVSLCDAAQHNAAADGTSASQAVSAFVIDVAPKVPANLPAALQSALDGLGLTAGSQLIKVTIDPTVSTTAGAQAAVSPALPRTGPGAAATIFTGLMLTAGALILRRKAITVKN